MRQRGQCIEFVEGVGISGMRGGGVELHLLQCCSNRRHSSCSRNDEKGGGASHPPAVWVLFEEKMSNVAVRH